MTETTLYIARHGKTMFNTLGRVQGWSDTPLTEEGEKIIRFLGEGLKEIPFKQIYSSDSGRARQTAKIIVEAHQNDHYTLIEEPDIREWNFGGFEGGFDTEMWEVMRRAQGFASIDDMLEATISFEKTAKAVSENDKWGWAENYGELTTRIMSGFTRIAEAVSSDGGGNVLAVSHGMTIAMFLTLISDREGISAGFENGSVSKVVYKQGKFELIDFNNVSYIEKGKKLLG